MTRANDRWWIFVGTVFLSISVNAFIIVPSSITPLFLNAFDVGRQAIGYLVSVVFLGIILVQIPSGYVLDRFDNRRIVVPTTAGYVAVLLAMQFVDGYRMLLALRFLGGLGVGIVYTTGANVVAEVFADGRQSLATSVYIASPPLSFAISHATSPVIGMAVGPLGVFLLYAGMAVVGGILFWIAAGEPIESDTEPTGADFATALAERDVLLVAFSAATMFVIYTFLNTWLPTFGTEVLRLSLSITGLVTAIVPVAGIVARPVGGVLSEVTGSRDRLVIGSGLAVASVLLLGVLGARSFGAFLALLASVAFALQLGTGLYYVLIRDLSTPGTEGTSLTVLMTVLFMGSFTGPLLGGWLIANFSWAVAFAGVAALGVAGTAALGLVPAPADASPSMR
ncbi:MAG: MFS transporter [Halanaeroarchaeum sp.]